MVVIALGLIGSVMTARGLGAEGRGIYFSCITIAGVIAQFGTFGLTTSNTFIASKNPSKTWPLLVNSVGVAAVTLFLLTALLLIWGDSFSYRLGLTTPHLWLVTVLAPSLLLFNLGSCLLVANERFAAFNLWSIINALLVVAGMAVAIIFWRDPFIFVGVTCVAAVVSTFAVVVIQRPKGAYFAFSQTLFLEGISMSTRAYLALVLGYVIPRTGIFFIMQSHGSHELGVYSVAVQLFDVIALLPASIAMVLFPRLLKTKENQWDTTKIVLGVGVGIVTLLALIFFLVGQWLINSLFGSEFTGSFPILLAMLPGTVFYTVVSIISQYIVSKGFPLSLVFLWALGFVTVCVMAAYLVPSLGGIGAALSQTCGLFLISGGSIILALRRTQPPSHANG
jgi:O-antigen/teichoic acid export membrane protein